MTTHAATPNAATTPAGAPQRTRRACSCSCPPDDPTCRLECLVRPRFYCGQLLFDDDLAAMVGWAAGRFGLQRFHDGWGVACGLDVRRDPRRPLGVLVSSGYAVSCCGDDIVVCEEDTLDLSGALGGDPCARPEAVAVPADPSGGSTTPPPTAAVIEGMQKQLAEKPAPAAPTAQQDCWVDVVVRHAEREADPRASLHHSGCVQAPECEPARIRETHELDWAPSDDDPGSVAAREWCTGYEGCHQVVRDFPEQAGWKAQRDWLVAWIDRHPPALAGDLRVRVSAWTDAYQVAGEQAEILLRLVLDCRWAYTRRPCHTCQRAAGVRLARVRLGAPREGAPVQVLAVDNHPPHRRPLAPAAAPAPFGSLNVGHLIGERWDEASRQLTRLGLRPRKKSVTVTGSASELLTWLGGRCPVVAADGDVAVQVAQLGDGEAGERVVGLHAGAVQTASQDLTEEEWRRVEVDRLKAVGGISSAVAERLYDAGLTLARIAATDDRHRAEVEAEIAKYLSQRFPGTAAEVFDQARKAWEQTHGAARGRS